jgi:F-type H+-transporting ATPase subunit beta
MATATATKQQVGRIVQIIGPVVDVEFEAGHLPAIYNALHQAPAKEGVTPDVIAEVEQHPAEPVHAVAMKSRPTAWRGMEEGRPRQAISVPVGPETLGRVLNVLGEPVDFRGRCNQERWPIVAPRRHSSNSRPT